MKVIDPGHIFALAFLDGAITSSEMPGLGVLLSNTLTFVKREGAGYPGNVGHHPGTNMQEVIRVLISRLKYLDAQEPHPLNPVIIMSLRHCLWMLERRAAERHGRPFLLSGAGIVRIEDSSIEDAPTCQCCGHVGCDGSCRAKAGPAEEERAFACGKCGGRWSFALSALRDGWPEVSSVCCGSGAWTTPIIP